jgi:hypothetical protein
MTQQPPHASHSRWRVEILDPIANEWAPGSSLPSLEAARQRLAQAQRIAPKWRDDKTPVTRRIVRETTTYSLEAEEPACTCIHAPEEDAGRLLHASYCLAADPNTRPAP